MSPQDVAMAGTYTTSDTVVVSSQFAATDYCARAGSLVLIDPPILVDGMFGQIMALIAHK